MVWIINLKYSNYLKYLFIMYVQKIITPKNQIRYLLFDDNWNVVQPVKEYLKYLDQLGRSIYTLRTYTHHLKLYFEYLERHDLTWDSISEKGKHISLLLNFIGELKEKRQDNLLFLYSPRKNQTINQILNTVLGFYRYLSLNGSLEIPTFYIQDNFRHFSSMLSEVYIYKRGQKSFFRLKENKPKIYTISREQFSVLLSHCTSLRDQLLLQCLFEGGLRLGEALNLKLGDFHVWKNELVIQQHDDANPYARVKNKNEGTLPIPSYVMQTFCRYIAEEYPQNACGYVFVNLQGSDPGSLMQPSTVEKLFQRLSRCCSFTVHPHMLRHSHATELIEVGEWDILDVKTRLRHKHVQTTIRTYIHLSDEYKAAKYRSYLANLGEKKNETDPD